MNKSHKSNFVFYIFWASILLFGSIIAIVIFYKTNPAFIEELLLTRAPVLTSEKNTLNTDPNLTPNQNKQASALLEQDTTPSLTPESPKYLEPTTKTTADTLSKTSNKNTYSTPLPSEYVGDPLFKNVKLDKTSSFMNKNGTVYFAGSLTVVGFYPDAFNGLPEHSNNLYSTVSVTLAIGWKNLPSFSQIKTHSTNFNSPLTKSLSIPALQILSIETVFTDPIAQKQAATDVIENYLNNVFLQGAIPTSIVSLAQQRLASSYIQKGYQNIILHTQ